MACCFASRPAAIPAAFIQRAFNGAQPTRAAAASVRPPGLSVQSQSGGSVADGRVGVVDGVRSGASQSDLAAAAEPAELGSVVTLRRRRSGADAYLHDAVPVVARGDLKQGEEGHAEVLEGGVTTHTLAWVVCVANWGPERKEGGQRGGKEEERRR